MLAFVPTLSAPPTARKPNSYVDLYHPVW